MLIFLIYGQKIKCNELFLDSRKMRKNFHQIVIKKNKNWIKDLVYTFLIFTQKG